MQLLRIWFRIIYIALLLAVSGQSSTSQDEKVQPEYLQDGKLAAKLTCQPKEIRHFHYESQSRLWGEAGGDIKVSADLAVHCLGADLGGKYGSEALKYLVELSNVQGIPDAGEITSGQHPGRGPNEALRRSKRGVGDFFRSTWTKVKCFFKRLFGNGCSDGNDHREDDPTPPPYEERGDGGQGTIYRESGHGGPSYTTTTTEPPEVEVFNPAIFEREYSLPFEFVQLANGTVPEVRFAANESDTNGAKTFKRHLTDVFNTYLDRVRNSIEETSPLGTHRTKYSYKNPSETSSTTSAPIPEESDMLTVTRRMDPGDLMSLPTDNPQMNDIRDIHVQTNQVQTFSDGEMIASNGELQLSISNEIGKRRRRRRRRNVSGKTDDLISSLDIKTSFKLQLRKRHKRELEDIQKINELEKSLNFKAEPLGSTLTSDSFARNRLESLRDKFKAETEAARYVTEDDYLANTESISTMLEILELENKLMLDRTTASLTPIVSKLVNPEKTLELCVTLRSNNCRSALLLLASTGGKQAEKTLVYLVQQPYIQTLALLSATVSPLVPNPSQVFVETLMMETENELRRMVVRSALANTVSLLALKRPNRDFFERHMVNLLKQKTLGCKDTELTPSLLDALSNMGVAGNTRVDLIELARKCPDVQSYQTGVVQALKGSLNSSDVQDFFLEVLNRKSNCHSQRVMLDVLTTATKNLKANKDPSWPAHGVNSVDKKLVEVLSSADEYACSKEPIVEYFNLKQLEDELYKAIITYSSRQNETRAGREKRRGFWDRESCDDWTKHRRGSSKDPVDGFEVEGDMYNRWSHCDSGSYFGRRMANAEFMGGLFAGVSYPSEPAKYKVEAKMTGEAHFLGKQFPIGTISFGLSEKTSNAYVKLLGRTLLDLKETEQNGCSADEFVYRPAEHIPLYTLNVWIVEVSLGIHLGVDAALNFACPGTNIYQFNPTSRVRVGGEGMGRILMLRGGINLGGNFNYQIHARLQPYPQACFAGKYGFDPMSISIETWYQFRKLFSDDQWSRRKLWSPNLLKWNMGAVSDMPWTRNYCIIPKDLDVGLENVTRPSSQTDDLSPEESNSGNNGRPVKPDGTSITTTTTTITASSSNEGNDKIPNGTGTESHGSGTTSNSGEANPNNAGGEKPNSGGTNPTSGGTNPTSGGTNPTSGGTNPTSGGTNPTSGGTNPTSGGTNPTSGGTNPTSGGTNPTSGGTNPTSGGANPTATETVLPTNSQDQSKEDPSNGGKGELPMTSTVTVATVKATADKEPGTTTHDAGVFIPDKKPESNPDVPSPSTVVIERTTIPIFVVKAPLMERKRH